MIYEFLSLVKNNKLQKGVSVQIAELIKSFEGKRLRIRIEKAGASRSLMQNNFLHLLFGIASQELISYTGDEMYTPAKIKNMMKTKFLLRDVVSEKTGLITGQEVLRTRDLNKEDYSVFIEQVMRHFATEYNIILPSANEQFEMDLDENN